MFCKVEDYFLENRTEVMSKEIAWSHAAGFKFLIRCWHSKFCSSTNWSSGAWKKIGVWSAKKMASSSRPFVASSLAAGQISGSAARSCWTVITSRYFSSPLPMIWSSCSSAPTSCPRPHGWAHEAQKQVENLVCDVPELQQQNRSVETQWPAQRKWRSPRNVRRSPRLSAAPGEVWVVRVSAQSKAI